MSCSLPLSRRAWLRLAAAGALGGPRSGWMGALARAAAPPAARARACILLWMSGGPSQMDTFDLKPGHKNGGPFKEIATRAPGLRISEHLPKLAAWGRRLAVVRSLTTKEGDHDRAAYQMHTGYLQQGPVAYPTLGSLLAHELGREDASLPNFVSIAPSRQFIPEPVGPGFLGPAYAPLCVADNPALAGGDYKKLLRVPDLAPAAGVPRAHAERRIELLDQLGKDFLAGRPDTPVQSHAAAVGRAVRLMRSGAGKAFDLDQEPSRVRDAYGRTLFGQGCLMARRLVERGVPFVEVALGGEDGGLGWDTHNNNFEQVKKLSAQLDAGWAALLADLADRGMLESTLVVWMGEFGRTPAINENKGRDHFTAAWSVVLAGGGVRGGQAYGKTSPDGTTVAENPVTVPDLLATVCKAVGVNPEKQNVTGGRPIRIVEKGGRPIQPLLG